jgi:hypothetical protein
MRSWVFVFILLWITSAPLAARQSRQPQQGTTPKATVQGIVVHAGSGQPLKGVRISFQRSATQQPQQPAANAGVPAMLGILAPVVTDASGRFVVTGVDAGQYRIFADRDGFIRQEFGQRRPSGSGTLVSVVAGQELTLNFSMLPAGVISGRVFNEDNEPVSRTTVQAYTYRYTDGQRSLTPVGNGQTNDLGEYRIFWLPPGEYFLSVLASNATARQESRADLSARQADVPNVRDAIMSVAGPAGEMAGQVLRFVDRGGSTPEIYFPGTLDPESATPVALAAAAELRGIDFVIRPIATVKVRGRVTSPVPFPQVSPGVPPAPPALPGVAGGAVRIAGPGGGTIQLTLVRASGSSNPMGQAFAGLLTPTRINPDGTFEIDGVVPGSYTLTASARVPPLTEYVARTRLEVGNADINGVNLALSPGVAIQGRLLVEQPPPADFKVTQLRVQLNSTDGRPMNRTAAIQEDGSFKLESVPPGDYRVFINNSRPGWYLESGRIGSQDAVSGVFTVAAGQDQAMQLQLGFTTGSVSGQVVDQRGDRFPGALAVLVPDGARRGRPNAYFSASTDQDGKFNFGAVPPGGYKLFAWEDIPSGAYQDPVYLRRFEDRGRPVRVERNTNTTAEVPVITAQQ